LAIAYTLIKRDGKVTQEATFPGQPPIVEYEYIQPGDSVSQDELGVDDETWASYYRDHVVGDEELPEDLGGDETLTQYWIRKANEQLQAAVAGSTPEGWDEKLPDALRGSDAPQTTSPEASKEQAAAQQPEGSSGSGRPSPSAST
jgi:hypothetical protein